MNNTVVGSWILENKKKYFSSSLSLPEQKANDIQEVIHHGWNEEDNIVVQEELKKELIKAYPKAKKQPFPNGEYPTNEDAGFQEGMRCASSSMNRKYGDSFWPQGAVFKDFKWRIIEQLLEVERCMSGGKPRGVPLQPSRPRGFIPGEDYVAGRKSRYSKKSRKSKSRSRKTRRRL
jgi:hypothetical protein